MKTLKKMSRTPLAWLGMLILSLGLAIAFKLTVKAQNVSGNGSSPGRIHFIAFSKELIFQAERSLGFGWLKQSPNKQEIVT